MTSSKLDVSFQLAYSYEEDYLNVHVGGVSSVEVVVGYVEAVYQECHDRGVKKVLIREELKGSLSMGMIFDAISEVSRSLHSPLKKIAWVDMLMRDAKKLDFAQTMARSRGIPINFFTSVSDAKTWLSSAQNPY